MHHFFHLYHSQHALNALFSAVNAEEDLGGRGGIRTHGGFPHARFRVECLKPGSATLPRQKKERRTFNVQHPTSNASLADRSRSQKGQSLIIAEQGVSSRLCDLPWSCGPGGQDYLARQKMS